MHCASCKLLIKDELTSLFGVSDVLIDHKTGKGQITINEGKVSNNEILSAIKKAGYTGLIDEKDNIDLVKKGTKSKDPMKLSFQSHIKAEGEVVENGEGKLVFQGKVDNKNPLKLLFQKGKKLKRKTIFKNL